MGIMQRRKGANGERELVKQFNDAGFTARRTAPLQAAGQYNGVAPDITVEDLEWLWIECKRQKRVSVRASFKQASDEALAYSRRTEKPALPILCYREDQREWLCTVSLADMLSILTVMKEVVLYHADDERNET